MLNDINGLDEQDLGLKGIFGDRFHDESAESGAQQIKKQKTTYTSAPTKAEQKGAHKRTEECKDAEWEPAPHEPTQMEILKASAKSVLLFGGLNLLIFYWQQAGLMASSIAVPCMCICAALAGLGVGKNAARR